MSSIIEGYNYDIFISCHQKDNKGDRWVSEFVKALKTGLESTLKEEIRVYFDFNHHAGLSEKHDVDALPAPSVTRNIFRKLMSIRKNLNLYGCSSYNRMVFSHR